MTTSDGYRSVRFSHDALTVPGEVREVVNIVVNSVPALAGTVGPTGGVNRPLLREALEPLLPVHGFEASQASTFGGSEIDFISESRALAVSAQGGRASTNNAALLALLAAASLAEIEWVVVVVPHTYKASNTFDAVASQFQAIASTRGVALSLQAAFIVGF